MEGSRAIKIIVRVEKRADGGLRIWSDDVPGLILSGDDPARVLADIGPAIEAIVSEMVGHPVSAHELTPMPHRARRGFDRSAFARRVGRWFTAGPERREFSAAPAMP